MPYKFDIAARKPAPNYRDPMTTPLQEQQLAGGPPTNTQTIKLLMRPSCSHPGANA